MKETILMLHGMWGTNLVWNRFKEYFESIGYSCITPVLRFHNMKHGAEPNAALGRTSLLDYIQDLEKEISTLGSKPIIMGHSMGGLLAQMLAAKGLAKALVLLAPAQPAGLVIFNISAVRSILSEITKPGFWNKPVRITYKEAVYGLLNRCSDELKKELYDICVYESGRATFEIALWYFDRRKASVVDESKITCPILMIAGKEDRIIPIAIAIRIAKKYQLSSSFKELENHAHWLLAEPGWEDVAGMVKDWMQSL